MPEGDGYDRLGKKSQEWGDRQAGELADHPKRTMAKWLGTLVGIIVVIAVVGAILRFAGAWGGAVSRIVSPANVEKQFYFITHDWDNLQEEAQNACGAVKSSAKEGGNSPTFLGGSPALAYEQTYRRTATDYKARQQNFFEAKHVHPSGYPKTVPLSPQASETWCQLSEQLEKEHP